MIVTQEMIFEKLISLEKELKALKKEHVRESIEEISLNKAARLLHLGASTVTQLVERGQLKARVYRVGHKKRYRFKIADITEFQESRSTDREPEPVVVETAEQIIARLVPKSKTRRRA